MAKALDFIDPEKLSMTVVLTAMNRFLNETDGTWDAIAGCWMDAMENLGKSGPISSRPHCSPPGNDGLDLGKSSPFQVEKFR